jgi:hypothetical protein
MSPSPGVLPALRRGMGTCATAGLSSRAEPGDPSQPYPHRFAERCGYRSDQDRLERSISTSLVHGWTSQPWHTGRTFDQTESSDSTSRSDAGRDTEGLHPPLAWSCSPTRRRSKLVAPWMTARAGSGEKVRQSLAGVDSDRSVACSRRRRDDRLTPYAGSASRRKRPAGKRLGMVRRSFRTRRSPAFLLRFLFLLPRHS